MPDALRHEVRIGAPPDVVFRYFTDPARMTEWFGVSALLDPRPGGVFRVDVDGRNVTGGEYVEVDPPRRVVFTWGFQASGSSRVEVTLEPDGEGTLLVLLHHGLTGEARERHEEGWPYFLGRLATAAGR